MTVFVTLLIGALMLVVGLVVDGGAARAARSDALDEATSAARAGAQMIDEDTLRREHVLLLDGPAVTQAAKDFIAGTGDRAVVAVDQPALAHDDQPKGRAAAAPPAVTVTVTRKVSMQFLWAVGVSSVSESATATVSPEPGSLP